MKEKRGIIINLKPNTVISEASAASNSIQPTPPKVQPFGQLLYYSVSPLRPFLLSHCIGSPPPLSNPCQRGTPTPSTYTQSTRSLPSNQSLVLHSIRFAHEAPRPSFIRPWDAFQATSTIANPSSHSQQQTHSSILLKIHRIRQ